MRWQQFSHEILGVCHELGVEMVVTLGALLADSPHTRPVPVTGTSSDEGLTRSLQPRAVPLRGADRHRRRAPGRLHPGRRPGAVVLGGGPALRRPAALPQGDPRAAAPHRGPARHARSRSATCPRTPGPGSAASTSWPSEDAEVAEYVRSLEEAKDLTDAAGGVRRRDRPGVRALPAPARGRTTARLTAPVLYLYAPRHDRYPGGRPGAGAARADRAGRHRPGRRPGERGRARQPVRREPGDRAPGARGAARPGAGREPPRRRLVRHRRRRSTRPSRWAPSGTRRRRCRRPASRRPGGWSTSATARPLPRWPSGWPRAGARRRRRALRGALRRSVRTRRRRSRSTSSHEWVPGRAGRPSVSRADAERAGIWATLQRRGHRIDVVRQTMTAALTTDADAELLGEPAGTPAAAGPPARAGPGRHPARAVRPPLPRAPVQPRGRVPRLVQRRHRGATRPAQHAPQTTPRTVTEERQTAP